MKNKNNLPRWRGFNLLEMFTEKSNGDFREDDFRWISDWGFDFVRLPLSYLAWTEPDDWTRPREEMIAKIDRAVELGGKYGLHIDINFHRAPGYCIAPTPAEPFNLWKDKDAEDVFCLHWEFFSRRYSGIDGSKLSFDLVNEPPHIKPEYMTRADYGRVVRHATAVIRSVDPNRLVIADGVNVASTPCPELADLGVGQSCRAYAPMGLSHYGASWTEEWMPQSKLGVPQWPGSVQSVRENKPWGRDELEEYYKPWIELARSGVGVHCGEGGAFNKTPHDVVLRWWADIMDILRGAEIGWALWNFRGSMGIIDSGRSDVAYENWHGHLLDAEFLKLLQGS